MHGTLLTRPYSPDRQRSAPELHALLGAAGFVNLTSLPTAGLFSVTVGVKPPIVAAAVVEQPPPEMRPTRKRPASPVAMPKGEGRTLRKLPADPLA